MNVNLIRRRSLLQTTIAAVAIGLEGCLGAGPTPEPTPTPTPTPSPTPTPTNPEELGTIEYTITNADDVAQAVSVTMTNAAGQVVQETNEPSLAPGASVESGSAGHPPADGPFELTFTVGSTVERHTWDVLACARVHLAVTVTAGGGLTVERDLCQN